MPIIEFKCADCGHTFEESVFSADEAVPCPACKSTHVEKLISLGVCRDTVFGFRIYASAIRGIDSIRGYFRWEGSFHLDCVPDKAPLSAFHAVTGVKPLRNSFSRL